MPSTIELRQFKKIIVDKLDKLCTHANFPTSEGNLYLCPNSFECLPVQEQIGNLIKTFPNVNIKTPLFKLHANFYGTDNLSAFSVNINHFLQIGI